MNQKRFEPDPDSLMMAEFFDDQPHPIVWLRPLLAADGVTINDFRYTYCNSEGLRFLNLTPGDQHNLFLSTTPTLSDNLRKEILEEMIRIIKTGEKSETTFFNPPLNKYVRVVRSRLRGGILTVVKDLTPEDSVLRRMEEQTREIQAQKNLLDNILKHSSNGITVGEMIRNSAGAIVDIKALLANDAACRFTGFSKERYLTKTGGELDPAFVGSPYFQLCVRCMETGEPFITQYYLDSLHVWLEVSVSKMDEEHQIYIFTDVTPVKEAQLATERSAAQLETIINRTQSGVLAISPVTNEKGEIIDFRFVLANKAVAAYVQQDPAVLIGDVGSQWFTSYKSNGLFDLFCDTYNHHKENRFDFHYNTDGIDAWIDMMCTRFDNDVLITFTDYTPVKKLQLELQKTVEELKQSNAGLEEFAYAASHDLQEPLRKIHAFSDRLHGELVSQLSSTQEMMFQRIKSASSRMRQLIEDLLAYSQVSRKPQAFSPVDLNSVVEDALQNLEESIRASEARVHVSNLPVIHGDERQLQQLFQNLIGNAVKYCKPDVAPAVTISCYIEESTTGQLALPADATGIRNYRIEVADNGIGFEQAYAEKIFEVFHRLHSRSEYEGTGIGLAIVQRVVHNHEGYIKAAGKPGEGATFTVWLPA